MRKLLLLAVALGLGFTATAQISVSKDTAYINLEPNEQVKGLINVLNPNEDKYYWRLAEDQIFANYSFIEMCDCKDCFGNKAYPSLDSCAASDGSVKTFSIEVLADDTVEEGFFIVEVFNADTSETAELVFMVRPTPSSTPELELGAEAVKLLPNPSSGSFEIQAEGFVSASIYNITGSLVYSSNDVQIHMGDMPKGLYLVEVSTTEGRKSMKLTLK